MRILLCHLPAVSRRKKRRQRKGGGGGGFVVVTEEVVLAFGDSLLEDGVDVREERCEPHGDVFVE